MDLKNMNLRAQGFEIETNPDIIADQLMKTVFKIFAEREQRKKQKEKVISWFINSSFRLGREKIKGKEKVNCSSFNKWRTGKKRKKCGNQEQIKE